MKGMLGPEEIGAGASASVRLDAGAGADYLTGRRLGEVERVRAMSRCFSNRLQHINAASKAPSATTTTI